MIVELLGKVCNKLNDNGFLYMISGSIALNMYTIPRMTRDIDIVIELSVDRMDVFISLFKESYFNKETIREEINKKGMFNIIDHESGFKLDFIIRKNTPYFRKAFERRKKIKEFETEVWVISPEDLIIAKIIWIQDYQSDKQISDIESLLLFPEIDFHYISYWCKEMQLSTFNLFKHE